MSPPPTKSTAWAEATRSRWILPAGPICRPSWWWDRTGASRLPLAGDILLDGLTRSDASKAIAAALASYYDNLAVQVTVTKYTANRVLVLGAVTNPGEVTFEGTPTLLEALTRSGLSPGQNKPAEIPERCAIYRGSNQVVWVQLRELVESGNPLADLRLRRDDVIYVPSLSERFVSVLGEVQHPGAVPLTEQLHAGQRAGRCRGDHGTGRKQRAHSDRRSGHW